MVSHIVKFKVKGSFGRTVQAKIRLFLRNWSDKRLHSFHSIHAYVVEQNRKPNGQLQSIDHIAEDHIHTDITFFIQEAQQKYRLGMVSNRLLGAGGAGGSKHIILDPNLALCFCYNLTQLNNYYNSNGSTFARCPKRRN